MSVVTMTTSMSAIPLYTAMTTVTNKDAEGATFMSTAGAVIAIMSKSRLANKQRNDCCNHCYPFHAISPLGFINTGLRLSGKKHSLTEICVKPAVDGSKLTLPSPGAGSLNRFQALCMISNMLTNKGRDEVIAVVITFL